MKNLSAYGFIPAGQWISSATVNSGIAHKLTALDTERVVYAFVVDGTPKYIGICEKDSTTLKDRMGRYKNQLGGVNGSISTNKRISINIKRLLDQGKKVEIFALKPAIKDIFVDLQVDLVKGLENPLVASFKPEWNR